MTSVNCGAEAEESAWDTEFSDRIANVCYKKYEGLPKKGKPNNEKEWTLMACVVKVKGFKKFKRNFNDICMEVVSLGTGSKCVGKSKMSPAGDILNDSHAEVMARRGFLCYLYHEIIKTYQSGSSEIFHNFSNGKCTFNENVTFHFFSSHTPCGDASIIPKVLVNEDDVGLSVQNIEKTDEISDRTDLISNEDDLQIADNETPVTSSTNSNKVVGNTQRETSVFHNVVSNEITGLILKDVEYNSTCYGDVSVSKNIIREDFGLSLKVVNPDAVVKEVLSLKDIINTQKDPHCKTNVNKTLIIENTKRKLSSVDNGPKGIDNKKKKLDNDNARTCDIYRTGAKCLPTESVQDEHLPGSMYHVVGVLRTKPGRGDRTLSLSCSDKITRWNAVGCQGALLSLLINKPVYFQSVIVGGGCPFSKIVLQRAIIERVSVKCRFRQLCLPEHYSIASPIIAQSTLPFVHRRNSDDKKPCPSSIVWCHVLESALQVAVEGKKQGVTKKLAHTAAGRLFICKKELLCQFVDVALSMPECTSNLPIILKTEQVTNNMDKNEIKHYLTHMSYKHLKYLSKEYNVAWEAVKNICFPSWVRKCNSLLDFISSE